MKVQFARLAFAIALFVGTEAAAQRVPMTAVDLLEVPVLTDPRLSPDGDTGSLRARRSGLGEERTGEPHLASRRSLRGPRSADPRAERGVEPPMVARRRVDCLRRRARGGRSGPALPDVRRGRRVRTAHEPRNVRLGPLVLAGRETRVLPRRGRQDGRGEIAREAQGRRLRVRRELEAPPPLGPVSRRKDHSPSHRRRLHGARVSALSRRNEGRAPSRAFASPRSTRPRARSTS